MSRTLRAKQGLTEAFPVVRFSEDGFVAVRDRATDVAPTVIIRLNDDDEPVIDFGLRSRFTFAEMEALTEWARAIDPRCPDGLFADVRQRDIHSQW